MKTHTFNRISIRLLIFFALISGAAHAAEDKISGAVEFYNGYPDFLIGKEMTGFLEADDFELTERTVIHGVRFWTLEVPNRWDGVCEYKIYRNTNNRPGETVASGSVAALKLSTGRLFQPDTANLTEFQYDMQFKSPIVLSAGTYWLNLHMSADCLNDGIYWESGSPGFGNNARLDDSCNGGGWTDAGNDFAFSIFGTVDRACLDLAVPDDIPLFLDTLGNAERGVAVDMAATARVNSLGILVEMGEPTILTVNIRNVLGTALGAVVGTASIAVTAGGPKFYDVPINFTFQAGQRYDIAFNVTGGWGNPSDHALEFFVYDNPSFNTSTFIKAGPFHVLDGRGQPPTGSSNPYANQFLPHVHVCLATDTFEAYGLMINPEIARENYLVGFNLATPQNLTAIAQLPAGSSLSALDFRPGISDVVYALDATQNDLLTINTQTGETLKVGDIQPNGSERFTGMSFDPASIYLYASGSDAGIASSPKSSLYRINPTNGSTTRIGQIQNSNAVIGVAFSPAGLLYGIDLETNNLMRINTSNGNISTVGSLGIDVNFSQGLEFQSSSGNLYGALYNLSGPRGELRQINTTTGASSLIGLLGSDTPGDVRALSSITFPDSVTPVPTATPTVTATATPGPTATPITTLDSAFIRHGIIQEAIIEQLVPLEIRVRNTGSATWSEAGGHRLAVIADSCQGTVTRLSILNSATVAPNQDYTFTGVFRVPAAFQICTLTFQMIHEGDRFFGPSLPVPITAGGTIGVDFTRDGGNAFGWAGGIQGGAGQTALSANGICMTVPETGDNIPLWVSPEQYITLKDKVVYRVRVDAVTDQQAVDRIPFWDVIYDNFNTSGFGNTYGGEVWFLDVAGGSNGIGRANGLTQFQLWAVPNAALTPQWRGLVGDGTVGAFHPSVDTFNDMRLIVRILDAGSSGINANIDSGTICISSLHVDTFSYDSLAQTNVYNPPISNTTHAAFTNTQNPVLGVIDNPTHRAFYRLDTTADRATLIPAVAPQDNAGLYPIEWVDNQLYLVKSDFALTDGASGTDPIDVISMIMDTATVELGAVHVSTRGSEGNMHRTGSPRLRAVTGTPQTYIGFFYSHHATDGPLADTRLFRPQVDMFNVPELFGIGTGGDPFEILNLQVVRIPL